MKKFFFTLAVGIFLSFYPFPLWADTVAPPPPPDVEAEIGPKFTDSDSETVNACYRNIFETKFPLDFFLAPIDPDSGSACPSLDILGHTHEACFVLDIYYTIEPALVGGLIIYAVFLL